MLLSGCATQEKYQSALDRHWVGAKVDALVIAWGPPTATYKLQGGGAVMEWSEDRGSSSITTASTPTLLTSSVSYSCRIKVHSSEEGVVKSIGLEGNSCVSR